VLVVLNLVQLVVHPHNHHKTLEFQVFNNLEMLVVLLLDTRVVLVVVEVLVVQDILQVLIMGEMVDKTQSRAQTHIMPLVVVL
jgi:hypothetical protein